MTTKIPDGLHVFLFTDAGLLIAGPIPFSVDRIIGSYSIDGTIYILSDAGRRLAEYWGFIRMVTPTTVERFSSSSIRLSTSKTSILQEGLM
jgi:hypothetical protein